MFEVRGSAWDGVIVESSETKEHERSGPIPPAAWRGCARYRYGSTHRGCFPRRPVACGGSTTSTAMCGDRPGRALGVECTPQDFRHRYVSNLSAAGIDVADLAAISRHSIETAQQRYRHALRRSFEQVRQTVG